MIGTQFQQQALFDHPSPTGGGQRAAQQRVSPIALTPAWERRTDGNMQGALMNRGQVGKPSDPATRQPRPPMEDNAFGHMRGGQFVQLPALMSTSEIRTRYQALDGDREDDEHSGWSASSSSSSGSGSSSGNSSSRRSSERYTVSGSREFSNSANRRPKDGSLESDDELYERKYNEAEDWMHNYASLKDSILSEGVKNPVSLQDPANSHRGSLDKPEVLGGHHRIAVMDAHAPDEMIPVTHSYDILAAKREQGRRY